MEKNDLERILEGSMKPTILPFETLRKITDGFSSQRIIGEGGFGTVYKGIVGNKNVAVKRIMSSKTINDKLFRREVNSLMEVNHANVVKFLGLCSHTVEIPIKNPESSGYIYAEIRERLLCFEYMSNGSLDTIITDELRGLEWDKRYTIIKGVCAGLNYLHMEKCIIHMDLKPANILLDDHMVSKITDFGLSRPVENSQTTSTDHFVSLGYTAPENIHGGRMTVMSDMYSLGIIIIEVVTGHKGIPDNNNNILRRWWHRWIRSAKLAKEVPLEYHQQVTTCVEMAMLCLTIDPLARPCIKEIMSTFVEMDSRNNLSKYLIGPNIGQINSPASYWEDGMLGVEPLELQFANSQHNKILSWSVELCNGTDGLIAFNIQRTSSLPYSIEPNMDIVKPRSKCSVNITLPQGHKAALRYSTNNKQYTKEFIVRSIKVNGDLIAPNIKEHMFNTHTSDHNIDEIHLTVVCEEEENVDALIDCVAKNLGYCKGTPIAAFTIYKCLLHWKYFEVEQTSVFDHLIQLIGSAIENEEVNDNLAYWLSNTSTLLFLVQTSLKAAGAHGTTDQGLRSAPSANMHVEATDEHHVEAKYPALLFMQQLNAYVEQIYGKIRDNIKQELSSLISLCIEAPGKLMMEISARSSGQDQSNHWQKIIGNLDVHLKVLQDNHVPPVLAQKIFTRIFSYINVQLFNSLLDRRWCCSLSNGQYVQAGLSELELWCKRATTEYAAASWDEIRHTRQAVGFLVVFHKNRISYNEIVHELCPILSVQQLYRICTQYMDAKYNTQSVSSDVLSKLLMSEDSINAKCSSFLLNDNSSISFSVEDITNAMHEKDLSDVKPAEELLENPAFQFLHDKILRATELHDEIAMFKKPTRRNLLPPPPETIFHHLRQRENGPNPSRVHEEEEALHVYPYDRLRRSSTNPATNIDQTKLETYLSSAEFREKFGMSKEAFSKLPKWKQNRLKIALQLV